MNANQIPYDPLDWLQIGVYFLALPVVAMIGALVGLLGRWRRGGVVWSTNVGLLGGAVAMLIFSIGIWGLESKFRLGNYSAIFNGNYRWAMLEMTLAGTSGCGLVAGLCWRLLYAPKEVRPFAFSLKQLLIVQAFALVSLSVWMGLRLYMLQQPAAPITKKPDVARMPPGWIMDPNSKTWTLDGLFTPTQLQESALRVFYIDERAESKGNLMVQLAYDSQWNCDLAPLLQSEDVRVIYFKLLSLSPEFLSQVAKSKIKQVSFDGPLRDVDLSIVGDSSSPERLLLLWGDISPSTVESLSESKNIKHLQLLNSIPFPANDRAIQKWPRSIENLSLLRTNIGNRDLDAIAGHPNLAELYAPEIAFDEQAIAAISRVPNLRKVNIGLGKIKDGGLEPLAALNCSQAELHVLVPEFTLRNAQELRRFKGLSLLELNNSPIDDETVRTLAEFESMEELVIASHLVTEEGLLSLAKIPTLKRLSISNLLNVVKFQLDLNAKRAQLGLPNIRVSRVAPTSPLKAIIVK